MYKASNNLRNYQSRDNDSASRGKRRARPERNRRYDLGNEVDPHSLCNSKVSILANHLPYELSSSHPICKQSGELNSHSAKKLVDSLETASVASSPVSAERPEIVDLVKGKKPGSSNPNELDEKASSSNRGKSKLQIVGRDPICGADKVPKFGSGYRSVNNTDHSAGLDSLSNKLATITPPSVSRSDKTYKNVQFRKHVEILVHQHCWMVDKVVQLKKELNLIIQRMEELREGQMSGQVGIQDAVTSTEKSPSVEDEAYSNDNILQMVPRELVCNTISSDLSLPTLNVSDKSTMGKCPAKSNNNICYDRCWNANISMEDKPIHGRKTHFDNLELSYEGSSSTSESTNDISDLGRNPFLFGTCYILQSLFVIFLMLLQFIIQFVTMRG